MSGAGEGVTNPANTRLSSTRSAENKNHVHTLYPQHDQPEQVCRRRNTARSTGVGRSCMTRNSMESDSSTCMNSSGALPGPVMIGSGRHWPTYSSGRARADCSWLIFPLGGIWVDCKSLLMAPRRRANRVRKVRESEWELSWQCVEYTTLPAEVFQGVLGQKVRSRLCGQPISESKLATNIRSVGCQCALTQCASKFSG